MPEGWKGVVAGVDDAVGKGSSRYITICSAIILLHTVLAAPLDVSTEILCTNRVLFALRIPPLSTFFPFCSRHSKKQMTSRGP